MVSGANHAPRWTLVGIVLLTLLAALGRGLNLDAGLPYQLEADTVIVSQALELEHPEGSVGRTQGFNPALYPPLLGRLLYLMPGSSLERTPGSTTTTAEAMAMAGEPYLRGRILAFLLSIPALPLAWGLCRRFVGPEWALLAAALLATSFFSHSFSRMARPHGPLATASLLSLLATLRFLRVPSWRSALLAAGATSLAVAVLHSGIFVLPSLMLAAWWADPERPPRRWARFLLGAAAIGITVYFSYPALLEGIQGADENQAFHFGAQKLPLRRFNFSGYVHFLPELHEVEPALVALGLGGLIPLWLRRPRDPAGRRRVLVCVAHPVVTILCFGITDHVPGRFFLPILPWFALSATFLVRAAAESLAAGLPRTRRCAGPVLAAAALALPGAVIARLVWLDSRPTTQARLAAWLEERPEELWADSPRPFSLPIRVDVSGLADAPAWSLSHWANFQFQHLQGRPGPAGPRVHALGPPAPVEAWAELDPAQLRKWFGERIGPALLVTRRGAFGSNRNPSNRVLTRAKLIEAFGEPLFDEHAGSEPGRWDELERRFPLSDRTLRLFCVDAVGPSFEVFRVLPQE